MRGKNAFEFVQKITTNDVSQLEKGDVQYSAMCLKDGGIVDDLLVYNCGDYYMLVINASNINKDYHWMQENLSGDITLKMFQKIFHCSLFRVKILLPLFKAN